MSTKLSPSTPRSKLHRGPSLEADRTSPSVKTTSSMFAENTPKKRTPVSRGTELSQVQEELAKTKEQLALMEKSKANLLQDLVRSKRQVEDLTAKLQDVTEVSKKDRIRAEEMEHASFTAAEDWKDEVEVMREQYEAAILELEANKQTMDSLKHEMIMSIEAKNEAVRLAGEAMNAAESTAKRVEDLSAELVVARKAIGAGDSASPQGGELKSEGSCMHHDIKEIAATCEENSQDKAVVLLAAKEVELSNALQESMGARSELEALKRDLVLAQKSLADLSSSMERLQADLRLSKDVEMESGLQLQSLSSDLDCRTKELADAKEVESRLKCQIIALSSAAKQAKRLLADAKQAEELASEAARNAHEKLTKASADIERMKESESGMVSSLGKVSAELGEAQEKLTRVALEEVVFATFLESLKTELARNQLQLANMEKKEASARSEADTVSVELTKLIEAHQKDDKVLNEKLLRSNAAIDALRLELDRQKLDLAGAMERECTLNANAEALVLQLKHTQDEVMELKRQEMKAFERGTALSKELEITQKDLLALREKETSMTYKIGSLMDDLEAKQLEVSELCRRVASADDKAEALMVDLEHSLVELSILKEKESNMDSKAAALSVALASLSETTESKLLELKEKEKVASVKAVVLHEELRRISSEFEKALTDARVAREDANKLYESLQIANLERDQAMQQEQTAIVEATQSRKALKVASAEAQTAKYELQKALDAVHTTELKAHQGAKDAEVLEEKLQAAQNEVLSRKNETEAVRQQLKAASIDVQRLSKELDQERQEAQLVRQQVVAFRAEVSTLKQQTQTATDETEAAKQEVGKLRDLVEDTKSGEEEAQAACKTAENLLQDALIELAALKLQSSSSVQDEEEKLKALSKAPQDVGTSQAEFVDLNMRLQDTEKHLAMVTMQPEASIANTETLSRELDAIKLEKEGHENSLLDMHQLLADTEKAKSNMEAEIQRLLDDSKQRQTMKDAIDIPVHTEVTGRSFSFDCREDKPQPDFGVEGMNSTLSSLDKSCENGKVEPAMGEGSVENEDVALKDDLLACPSIKKAESPEHDEGSLKDEVASQDESPSLPMKKKKKNLLGRLGTLLDKKKHSQQQTP